MLAQAVTETKSLDHDKLADYMHKASFKTVVGDFAFGKDGEWSKSRMVWTQVQNAQPNNLDQFRDGKAQPIVWPLESKTGDDDLSLRATRGKSKQWSPDALHRALRVLESMMKVRVRLFLSRRSCRRVATYRALHGHLTYPARLVRLIVANRAGGSPEIVARLIGQWLSEKLVNRLSWTTGQVLAPISAPNSR